MAETPNPDDSGSLTRVLRVPRAPDADAGTHLIDGLRQLHRSRLQEYRDQLYSPPASPEDLAKNVLYRLLTGLIHGGPNLPEGHRMFVRLVGAILETQIAEQVRGLAIRRLGSPEQPIGLDEFLQQLRGGAQALSTFREGLLKFFRRLLTHPDIPEDLQPSLIQLSREVLSGEYPRSAQLAEKLQISRSRLQLRFHLLLAVASPSKRRDV